MANELCVNNGKILSVTAHGDVTQYGFGLLFVVVVRPHDRNVDISFPLAGSNILCGIYQIKELDINYTREKSKCHIHVTVKNKWHTLGLYSLPFQGYVCIGVLLFFPIRCLDKFLFNPFWSNKEYDVEFKLYSRILKEAENVKETKPHWFLVDGSARSVICDYRWHPYVALSAQVSDKHQVDITTTTNTSSLYWKIAHFRVKRKALKLSMELQPLDNSREKTTPACWITTGFVIAAAAIRGDHKTEMIIRDKWYLQFPVCKMAGMLTRACVNAESGLLSVRND